MADSTDEDAIECRQCGDPVESTTDRRVVTTVEDGQTEYEYFCDDDCLGDWNP
ncbi:DUF7576 family protein [Natronolimnohabitans innermongolicus]|uniref:TRASH domain-containing protein n=1 Tax=Natronolimnohabitans innermongolicus JCM 12255 TaxID=1227499 RepID=L9XA54_9EURY|nr:hypothetical protein [Natronolimnohabitans innermongolicus]ELY58639.1 hypothetical protein C493_06532 [Natronolimnohabitans innermongolicus JCM 12255]